MTYTFLYLNNHTVKAEIQFAQLLKVDAGAYSKALSVGRNNNCVMHEEKETAQMVA